MIHRALQARVGGSQADLPTSGFPGGTQAPVMQAVGRLPDAPGVYTFLDGSGARLYIGKASSLRSRVSQHFAGAGSSARGDSLLARVATITHQVTETELDAVILEQASIAQWRPPYNVQTTTHAGPPYLVIDGGIYPRIRGTRSPLAHSIGPMQLAVGDEGSGAIVFGPYRTTSVARQVARVVTRVFGVRPCARILPARRALMRVPCLLHGQGICPAPCAPNISPEAYATMVGMAIRWLTDGREVTFDSIDMRLRTLGREFATVDMEGLAGWEREWLLEVRRRLARVRTDERPVAGIARGADVYMACRLHWSVGRGFVVWHVRGGRVLHRRVWSPDSEIVFGTPDTDRLLAPDPARDTMVMRWVQRHAGLPELLVLDPDTASDRSVLGTLLRNWLHRVDREAGPWASVGLGDDSDFEEFGGMTTSE
jgi:excinuclease ABC subunit C